MEEKVTLQKEALEELVRYSQNLIPSITMMIDELREGRKEDTEEFLNSIIAGINWEIEVFNYCADLINIEENYIDKAAMGNAVRRLGQVLQENLDFKIADCFEFDFLPFLRKLEFIAAKV